ncbi:MAG: helix-turn-helix domain-containing protein [Deltaproteobacteria bacterium]|nr:helix-turn-helix domain-containing protein [Deltaproteobacteria bacterium]
MPTSDDDFDPLAETFDSNGFAQVYHDDKPAKLVSAPMGDWYTTAQAAAYLNLGNPSTVRSLVSHGDLKPDGKTGKGHMFSKATLDKYVTRNQIKDPVDVNRSAQLEGHQVPRRVSDGGRTSSGPRDRADRQQDNPSQASDARRGNGSRRGQGNPGHAGGRQEPADPYAPPADYKPDFRGVLRKLDENQGK